MLLDKYIKVKTHPSNYRHYIEKGYCINKCGESIEVKIDDLPKSSHIKVLCQCFLCKKKNKVLYYNYILFTKKYNFYTCYKCCDFKIKKTKLEKYGDEKYNNHDKAVKTCLDKYGGKSGYSEFISKITKEKVMDKFKTDNVFRLDYIKDKLKKTMYSRYGVEHALQLEEFFIKSQKSGFKIKEYNGINYQGKYELDFLIFCSTQNIKVKRAKPIKMSNNKIYYPDFFLPNYNLICEIKSSYYYEKELNKNLLKKEETIKNGFNYLFIINKDYSTLLNYLKDH